jgi:hypothetical protein
MNNRERIIYQPINGFTKETIIETLEKEFKGVSLDEDKGKCMYRGENGAKCAVGCFIPDEGYDKNMENKIASKLLGQYTKLMEFMPLEPEGLDAMQSAHDKLDAYTRPADALNAMINWVKENVA